MRDYLVIYEEAEDRARAARSPEVEGVFALGRTRQEAEDRVPEALGAHPSHLRERGEPIPLPRTQAGHAAA